MRTPVLIAALAALVLTGCQEDVAPGPGIPDPDRTVIAEAVCLDDGGTWKTRAGALNYCERPLRDSGQACSVKSDCAGLCLARSKSCAPVTPLFGCNEVLDGAGRPMTHCLD